MTPDRSIVDRATGSLLGLAVGDALGTTLEFQPRDARPPVTDMVGGGPFGLAPGQWTDDTSMALALADSLLRAPDLDAADLQARFLRWAADGEYSVTGTCFDIGQTTLTAIGHYRRTGEPFAGDPSPWAAGNGSIMRLAPVAIRWWHDPAMAERVARDQSATTHAAGECLDACSLLVRSMIRAMEGASKADVLAPEVDPAWASGIAAIADGAWASKPRDAIRSTGYVVDTLAAAFWAVHTTTAFQDAVLRAVNLGDDADTVGAVTGQLAGAIYGAAVIPAEWRARLWWSDGILRRAAELFAASGRASTRA